MQVRCHETRGSSELLLQHYYVMAMRSSAVDLETTEHSATEYPHVHLSYHFD